MSDLNKYMTSSILTTSPRTTLRGAARKMYKERLSYLIVLEKGKPVGIVTETDLARKAIPKKLDLDVVTVREIMSAPLVSIESGQSMEEANTLMKTRRIRHLLVIEQGKSVGLITMLGLLRYFSDRAR